MDMINTPSLGGNLLLVIFVICTQQMVSFLGVSSNKTYLQIYGHKSQEIRLQLVVSDMMILP